MRAFCFWLFLADLGRFLADLGRSWQIFGINLIGGWGPGFAIFGSKINAKIMKKHEKWGPEAPKMHQKSIKMRSGTLRAASWKQVGSRNALNWPGLVLFSGFLAEKWDFGSHFGGPENPGGAKNDPKNSIRRLFGAQKRKGVVKSRKKAHQKIVLKMTPNKLWKNMEKDLKMEPKSMPKTMKNLYNFGTCESLFFAKSPTLKWDFHKIDDPKIH